LDEKNTEEPDSNGPQFASFIETFDIKRIRKQERTHMADDNSTGTNMIWAVAMIIIVAIIAGALYYSGTLSGRRTNPTQKIDVEVSAPAR
jgi:hypothetical protein